jgi:hypothetical protein
VQVIECVLEQVALFYASDLMSREFRMRTVCLIWDGNGMEVKAGRRDTHT